MNIGPKQAVIICNHVFDGAPILAALRDAPLDSDDSGWQFHCNKVNHNDDGPEVAKVISIEQIIDFDESLQKILTLPIGTVLRRKSSTDLWEDEG